MKENKECIALISWGFASNCNSKLLSSVCQQILPMVSISELLFLKLMHFRRLQEAFPSSTGVPLESTLPRSISSTINLQAGAGVLSTSPLHANTSSRHSMFSFGRDFHSDWQLKAKALEVLSTPTARRLGEVGRCWACSRLSPEGCISRGLQCWAPRGAWTFLRTWLFNAY